MARKNLENLSLYGEIRAQINDNYIEIYDAITPIVFSFDFDAFQISGISNLIHMGSSIAGNQTFTWNTSNSTYIKTDSIEIEDKTNATILGTGLTNDGSEILTLPSSIDFTTLKTNTWEISGINEFDNSLIITKEFSVKSAYNIWYGISTSPTLTEGEILSLSFQLIDGNNVTFTVPNMTVPAYLYIIYDNSFDDLDNINRESHNVVEGFSKLSDVPITENSIAHTVKVYRSNNLLTIAETGKEYITL